VWSAPDKSSEEAPAEPPGPSAEQLVERDRRALLALLDVATVGRNGVHLDELYERTSAHPLFEGVPRENLTAFLAAFGVPITRTLSVDGVGGRTGVRRADVHLLLLAASPDPAGTDSRGTESGSDQEDSQPLSDDSQRPLGAALGQP
jgi:hypothetical protein